MFNTTILRDSLSAARSRGRGALVALLRQNESDDETIETKRLSEDENQDHANEKSLLLAHRSHTGVTHNANSHAGRETAIKSWE